MVLTTPGVKADKISARALPPVLQIVLLPAIASGQRGRLPNH